jgi:hypothetical protein
MDEILPIAVRTYLGWKKRYVNRKVWSILHARGKEMWIFEKNLIIYFELKRDDVTEERLKVSRRKLHNSDSS